MSTLASRMVGQTSPGSNLPTPNVFFFSGISIPAIKGFDKPLPGQTEVDPKVFLFGQEGSPEGLPEWSKDGTFLAFRQLEQLVPEFDKFLSDNPIDLPGLDREKGSELLGCASPCVATQVPFFSHLNVC
jgi:deferrochelatase/peroxidase EfeB